MVHLMAIEEEWAIDFNKELKSLMMGSSIEYIEVMREVVKSLSPEVHDQNTAEDKGNYGKA